MEEETKVDVDEVDLRFCLLHGLSYISILVKLLIN
jgi:hypothetical protein